MQLPLFVHTPVATTDSAVIRVSAGNWVIKTNAKDSILNLSIDGNVYQDVKDGLGITLQHTLPVRASIVKAGTEKHISLYLDDLRPD